MPGEKLRSLIPTPVPARLPDGAEVTVTPFTLPEEARIDELLGLGPEPKTLPVGELARARLYVFLQRVPGYEATWEEWVKLCDAEVYGRFLPVVDAIQKVNQSFRSQPARGSGPSAPPAPAR